MNKKAIQFTVRLIVILIIAILAISTIIILIFTQTEKAAGFWEEHTVRIRLASDYVLGPKSSDSSIRLKTPTLLENG